MNWPNAKEKGGQTALFMAHLFGHEGVVRLLIGEDDVDINADGRAVLSFAAGSTHGWADRLHLVKKHDCIHGCG